MEEKCIRLMSTHYCVGKLWRARTVQVVVAELWPIASARHLPRSGAEDATPGLSSSKINFVETAWTDTDYGTRARHLGSRYDPYLSGASWSRMWICSESEVHTRTSTAPYKSWTRCCYLTEDTARYTSRSKVLLECRARRELRIFHTSDNTILVPPRIEDCIARRQVLRVVIPCCRSILCYYCPGNRH